ncbi:MAG: ComEC family competence protein [Rhodospirillales bacterium]|nr:ComEC family competence protein [Rhodospirillales bacterium]
MLDGEQDRWILWAPVLFGAGIGFYFSLETEPLPWLGFGIFLLLSGITWFVRNNIRLMLFFLSSLIVASGFMMAQWRAIDVSAPILDRKTGPTSVSGRITDVQTVSGGLRIIIDRLHVTGVRADRTPHKARLRIRHQEPVPAAGDWIRARAILAPPPGPVMPNGYDFQRKAYFEGIGAVGFTLGPVERIEVTGINDNRSIIEAGHLRRFIADRINDVLGDEGGAVVVALMTGERGGISKETLKALRDAGLAHLLAISGLHLGLVVGVVFFGIRGLIAAVPPIALRFHIKKWAAIAAIFAGFFYAYLVGGTVPTQRAMIMVGIVLLAVVVDRQGITMRSVAWAALAILVFRPESLMEPGFQMSFAAVIALIGGYEWLSGLRNPVPDSFVRPWWRSPFRYLAGVLMTTVIASTATAPFAIYHFSRVALLGVAANLVAVPVTALWVMPWAVVAFLLMPLGLEAIALRPMGWGVDTIIWISHVAAAWPGSASGVPSMPVSALVLVSIGGLWLLIWKGRWRAFGGAGLLAGVVLSAGVSPPDVLIGEDGRLMGVRTDNGRLSVSTMKSSRFTRDVWTRRVGLEETAAEVWPISGGDDGTGLRCDGQGCIYNARGHIVALVKSTHALHEDCQIADVVISADNIRREACLGPSIVIDKERLDALGAHAVWLNNDGIRVVAANDHRGNRPWVHRTRQH